MNSYQIKFLAFLFLLIGVSSCQKEESSQLNVTVTLDGNPVADQFVSLIHFRSPGAITEGSTDAEGKVVLDTEDYVFLDGDLEELIVVSVDKAGAGYTLFQGFDQTHTIELATKEEVTIEVTPDLDKTIFSVGETIPIKMRLTSNYHPFAVKVGLLETKGGLINDGNRSTLSISDTVLDREGNIEFDYTTVAGENGFFISYVSDLHSSSNYPVMEFDIQVE